MDTSRGHGPHGFGAYALEPGFVEEWRADGWIRGDPRRPADGDGLPGRFYDGTLFTERHAPEPGSLDALMAAGGDAPFATDLRRLTAADADAVRGSGSAPPTPS